MGTLRAFLAISIVGLVILSSCATQAPQSTAPKAAPQSTAPKEVPKEEPKASAKEAPKPTAATAVPVAKAKALEPMDPPLSPPVTVRYGNLGNVGESAVAIAREKGYFKEQGLIVENVVFKSPAEMVPAVATGQIEVGSGAINVGLYNAIDRGINIRIVADKGIFREGHGYVGWVVRKDLLDSGQFQSAKDFKGKKVAVTDKTTPSYMILIEQLEKNGLTVKDVEVLEMTFPDMVVALTNKAVDVAVLIEPFVTNGINNGIIGLWKTTADLFPNLQNSILNYSPEFAKTEAAKRFMVAYMKGVRDYNNAYDNNINRKEIVELLAKNIPPNNPAVWDKMTPMGWSWNGYLNMESIKKVRDWFYANGHIKQDADISAYVDYQFIEYALRKLGKLDEKTGKPLD